MRVIRREEVGYIEARRCEMEVVVKHFVRVQGGSLIDGRSAPYVFFS
jgi:hypothetical protein